MTQQYPSLPGTVKQPSGEVFSTLSAEFSNTMDFSDFFDSISEPQPFLTVVVDNRGTVRLFNRNAADVTGFTPGSIIGRDAVSTLFSTALRDQAESLLLKDIGLYGDLTNIYLPLLTSAGHTVPVTWDISAIRDDQGALLGAVCIGHCRQKSKSPESCTAYRNRGCTCSNGTMHAILNHNQVAMGYLELAMEQVRPENELRGMLDHAYKALQRSSDLTLGAYRISRDAPAFCESGRQADTGNSQ
ncbi:PAS domain-containing protein [Methanocella arvoryzae]|uniref:Predicted signal transduction protein n=1 Tax=Methanocella arvoryzae (strain DSM 22066 / NBRC 105507 / MRE50) TaxID=351160 RepID=Q0W8I6_METAR|nr:PAS domain-containing protein [Methanocella arvoryzae]CAJ35307.1 predicted signal transduction protein [Methanocella arvoryzae MRE50]